MVLEQSMVPEPRVVLDPEDNPIPDADDLVIEILTDQVIDFDESSTDALKIFVATGGDKKSVGVNERMMMDGDRKHFSVPRAPACVWCCRLMGWSYYQFCRTQLAYLSLAGLLARLETSRVCLVPGTRSTSPGATATKRLLDPLWSLALNFERSVSDTTRGQMAPSAALREESGSGSLPRGRPQFIHLTPVDVKPTLTKEAFIHSALLIHSTLSGPWR